MEQNNYQYISDFINIIDADRFLTNLKTNIPWQSGTIKIFGKEVLQPRLFCFMADEGVEYSYSNKKLITYPWQEDVLLIKDKIEEYTKTKFNSVLLNQYRDGNDSMGWHSDDEKELGLNPKIASISFGAMRKFQFKSKNKNDKDSLRSIPLAHGSLFYMFNDFQYQFVHQIPKVPNIGQEVIRINLTFRKIL